MKKILKNLVYDTETAKRIGDWNNSLVDRSAFYEAESLYRKVTGEYFLHCKGGEDSKHSKKRGKARLSAESIQPLTEADARAWAEQRLPADAYKAEFNATITDDGKMESVELIIPAHIKRQLEARKRRTGQTYSEIIIEDITVAGRLSLAEGKKLL